MEQRLTLTEYVGMAYDGFTDKDETAFNQIERKAQRAVDAACHYYYEDHAIDQDHWEKRVNAYKAAIAEQIDFIQATGIDASYSNGDSFKTVSIGRLSLTPAVDVVANGTVHGVCKEAYRLLGHYGLLYRGVKDYAAKNQQTSV